MAVEDHIKIASSELMKAADVLRQEINQLKNDESNLRDALDRQIQQMTHQVQTHEQEIKTLDDPSARSQAQSAVGQLTTVIAKARSDHQKDIQRIQDAIRDKENTINALNQQAKGLL